jgi:serine phosphatase RsbU (regulator of sigma subunit)
VAEGTDDRSIDRGQRTRAWAVGLVLLGALLATRLYSYLLFHTLAETFSIVVAGGVFMVVWNARRYIDNGYLRVLGIAYAFVAVVDVLHMLAYRGMEVFVTFDPFDLPTQLWLAGRYIQAATLILAPVLADRAVRMRDLLAGYTIVTAALLGLVFAGVFPTALVEGDGLTAFKIGSEYVIAAAMLLALWLLRQREDLFDPEVYRPLVASIWFLLVAELAFTLYADPFGGFNLFGHVVRIGGFYLAYRAVVSTAIERPQQVIFRGLAQREAAERHAREDAEVLVAELLDVESTLSKQAREAEERYEQERSVASTMQRALLEAPDELRDAEVGHVYASSTARQGLVGGDFFEAFEIQGKTVALIGDVSGKGLEAAVLGTLARGALKTHAVDGSDPAEAAAKVNRTVFHFSAPDTFVTACMLAIEHATGRVALVNAGHPAPLLITTAGQVREMPGAGNLMLGAFESAEYSSVAEHLHDGDTVLLFTDGVIEARREGEVWGHGRLAAFVAERASLPPQALVEAIHREVRSWAGGDVDDDVAMLAVRWRPADVSGA